MAEKYLVGGYEFDTIEQAGEARKELQAVQYMAQKTDGCTPDVAYKIYRKIVDHQLFKTEIGLDYLRALEEFLMQNGMFDVPDDREEEEEAGIKGEMPVSAEAEKLQNDKLNPSDIPMSTNPETDGQDAQDVQDVQEQEAKDLSAKKRKDKEQSMKEWLVTSMFFNVLLAIAVAIMLYIASTGSSVNILNYETKLQDKYSSWSEELKQKETALKEREKEVTAREKEVAVREEEVEIREKALEEKGEE
ncbi:MAG: hypothetical protein ACI4AQ_03670 [Lachnospiraceae bacterium]